MGSGTGLEYLTTRKTVSVGYSIAVLGRIYDWYGSTPRSRLW